MTLFYHCQNDKWISCVLRFIAFSPRAALFPDICKFVVHIFGEKICYSYTTGTMRPKRVHILTGNALIPVV